MACKVIAISGPSGSGKSTLSAEIQKELHNRNIPISVITEDNYYRRQDHLTIQERIETNYDAPAALEHELLEAHLKALKNGDPIEVPQYCYKSHTRLNDTNCVEPNEILLVEGILLFCDQHLLPLFDIKVYVDTPLDICLLRRIQRDTKERGRHVDDIARQYEQQVKPMFLEHIEPSKANADILVDLTEGHEDALKRVLESLGL